MAVLSLLAAACGSTVAETRHDQRTPTDTRAVLKDVTFQEKDGEVSISIDTSRKVTYSLYQQEDPLRLILDLPQTSTGTFTESIPVNSGTVSFIKPVARDRGNSHLAFFLTAPSVFDVDGRGNRVKLKITRVKKEGPGPAGAPAAVVEVTPTLSDEPIESRPIVEETVRAPEPEAPLVVATAAVAAPPPESSLDKAEFVTALNVEKGPSGTLATIEGDGPLEYEYFLVEGKSLVIDIFNAGNKIWPTVYRVQGPFVEQVRIGEHFQPDKKVRVVFDLKKPGDYSVTKGANRIAVAFGEVEEQRVAAAAGEGSVNTVEEVYFRPLDGKSRVEIKTSSGPEFKVVDSEDPLRLIVEVDNARIKPAAQKTMDLSRLDRAVGKITAFQYTREGSPVVRVVVQLREAVPFRVAAAGKSIAIDIDDLSSPAAGAGGTAAATAPVAAAAPAAEAPAAAVPEMPASGPRVYTGKRLSLDFIEADINDILRLIADVSGLNFVSGPEVKGKVTIRLADVPWDQALDIILKTNVPPLAQIFESDTIVRVTTLGKIQEEHEAMRRAAEQEVKNLEAQKKLEPLVTRSFKISYANINEIQKIMREFTSDRVDQDGLLTVDERTGTIIVRDLQENVDEIARTIEALDSPTPAVVVEARIVEMTTSAAQDLGVQWNLNFSADPAHGNALPFEFPNSMGVTGGVGAGEGGSGGYMVNLPASSATSGIGISFGHIASTLSLDLRLTAMEQMGKTKILSTPRILVVQNEEAMINIGQELPIPSTDAEGNRTVTWRAVGINLTVKPQVTNDGKVFMHIRVAKESQGDPVPTTEGLMFSINSNKAETQVLIADGETAVIGGLTEEGTQESKAGTPGLSSIPGLGWLFSQRSKSSARKELMIFLTPKIVSVL